MGKKVEQNKETNQEEQENTESHLNRSIFVSGLPYSVDSDAITEFFANCGTIENIKLPRYQDTGKIIGYCHIIFSSPQEAQKVNTYINQHMKQRLKALKLNKQVMGGRYLDISISKGEKKIEYKNDGKAPEDCKTIFVKNIPFDSTEDEVGQFFEKCGKIINIRFVYHPHQKHFKGFAFIEYKMNSSVNAALKMNGIEFKGRKLMILSIIINFQYNQDFETGSMKQGFRFKKTEEGNEKYNQQYDDLKKDKDSKEKKIHKFDKLKNYNQKKNDFPKKQKKDNLKLFS